jgi:hypothetical protein
MRPSEVLNELEQRLRTLEQAQVEFIAEQKAFNEKLMERIVSIHAQTTMTNGRVTALEHWRTKMKGVWTAITIGGTIVVPVIVGLIWLLEKAEVI